MKLLRTNQIGFSQRVRLEWFEQTANFVLAGNDKASVYDSLEELLKDKVSVGSHVERSGREKTITILLKTWLTAPSELELLRIEGLELLKSIPRGEHMPIHWGMVMAVYPFWSSVATQTGRLLRLQDTAVASQIQRRIREQYGDRETASHAAHRVLGSFLDWGVLKEAGSKGIYVSGITFSIDNPRLIAWLIEAALHARVNDSAPLRDLLDSPSLFPFHIKPIQAESFRSTSPRLEILRHGLDDDLIILK